MNCCRKFTVAILLSNNVYAKLLLHCETLSFKSNPSQRQTIPPKLERKADQKLRASLYSTPFPYIPGYQGEDQCLERTACEAGELLRTFTTGAAFMFTALDYIAPFPLRRYLSVARDAAEGHSCLYYRWVEAWFVSLYEQQQEILVCRLPIHLSVRHLFS